ncbi:uncharacterized protein LOC123309594 [Coccinella septempunctata]|uniref:uncharacterized protein LOC123309594 n=1 Tax=Coccinella septempunctata TaxID=41139 RepID=UPI001D07C6D3|nr:uncharacterized protein LOC123309594 [Coccinella septempunctata]
MKMLWSIFGLFILGVAQEGESRRYNFKSGEDAPPATTEAPPVNVSSALSNYEGLNLIHNEEEKTIGFVNVTENVGVCFTAQEGGITKLLLDSKTGHVLSYTSLDKILLVQNDEFKGDVVRALELILVNYVYKNKPVDGKSSEAESSSEEAVSLWSEVYLHLGHPKEKGKKDYRSLKYLQIFAKRLKHLYLGSLKGLIVGKGPSPLKQNLNRFLTISIGLHELFGKAPGGLKNILSRNVSFEVNPLFNAKNGAEVLVYVLRQTGAKFDLSTLWGDLLNDIDQLLDIIQKLGGGESKNGVDETFAIIAHFWSAIHLRIPVTDFVTFLFESASEDSWSQADDGDFKQVLKDFKNITDQQATKYDNTVKLSGFVKFFTNLTTNQLIENNVNVSELVEQWRKRDAVGGLKTISHLTLNLFNPEKYSNLFFDSFTAFLNATSDKDAVKKILPGVSLDDFTGNNGSVLDAIRKNYKIDDQLKNGGDPSQVLSGIPVFNEFSKVYKDSLGRNFDFSKVLNGGSFSDYLSKLPIAQPFKWGTDGFSKFFKESGNIFSHIFIDPIRQFFPIPHLPSMPGVPNVPVPSDSPVISPSIPFLPPGIMPSGPVAKEVVEVSASSPTPKTPEDESDENVTVVIHASKKPSDDGDDDDAESHKTKNPTTPSSQETHLTASVSSSTSADDSGEVIKSILSTTEKCDDCEESDETKSTSARSTVSSTEKIEFKHHNRHHDHQVRKHHQKKPYEQDYYRHHNSGNGYENKHHLKNHKSHEDKHRNERNHNNRIQHHNGEKRQNIHNARHNSEHQRQEKHNQKVLDHHSDKHQERIQHKYDTQR